MIRILLLIVIILLGCLSILNYIKLTITIKKFREYLLSIGDEDTARRMGGLFFRLITEIEIMMEKRYEQTKNDEYLIYCDQYRIIVNSGRLLIFFIFVLLVIYLILTS